MSKHLGVLITVALAFAIVPAAALGGTGSDVNTKKAERLAKKQAAVDSFVACLNAEGLEVPAIDVEAVMGERSLAHRGRGRLGLRWFRGDSVSRLARFVVRAAELDRSDQVVRAAVTTC